MRRTPIDRVKRLLADMSKPKQEPEDTIPPLPRTPVTQPGDVVRVHPEISARQRIPTKLVSNTIWHERFEDIKAFEKHLGRNGTVVLKFSQRFEGRATA